jgi:hypothetical protein
VDTASSIPNPEIAMGKEHDEHQDGSIGSPMDPSAEGRTAGAATQSQGGISRKVAQAAREAGAVDEPPGRPLERFGPPRMSLDEGGGTDPSDGRAHHGFSGDDGEHLATGSTAVPAAREPGNVADLGAQQDVRVHGMPRDPAERTTGADTPNRGGIAGSPGGPARMAPAHMPGQEPDEGVVQGRQSGNDAQQDQQI